MLKPNVFFLLDERNYAEVYAGVMATGLCSVEKILITCTDDLCCTEGS